LSSLGGKETRELKKDGGTVSTQEREVPREVLPLGKDGGMSVRKVQREVISERRERKNRNLRPKGGGREETGKPNALRSVAPASEKKKNGWKIRGRVINRGRATRDISLSRKGKGTVGRRESLDRRRETSDLLHQRGEEGEESQQGRLQRGRRV